MKRKCEAQAAFYYMFHVPISAMLCVYRPRFGFMYTMCRSYEHEYESETKWGVKLKTKITVFFLIYYTEMEFMECKLLVYI